jgi:endonuclease G
MTRSVIAVPALIGIISGATLLSAEDRPTTQIHRRPAIYTSVEDYEYDFGEPQQSWIAEHCVFGLPLLEQSADYGPTWLIPHAGFVLQLSTADKIPLWVSEKVTAAQLGGTLAREDVFERDSDVPEHLQAERGDYRGSGYDRGHQAPAGNQTVSRPLKNETFLYTNMSPQKPYLNRSIWRRLEERFRGWVTPGAPLYIITGPIFYDPYEENPQTADGLVEHYTIGPGGVSVPTHFYKIALQNHAGQWRAIAFVMENRNYSSPYRLQDHRRSIDWIEDRTGFDFFPDMDEDEQQRLETDIAAMWD